MARGGINKTLVKKAKEALLAKGLNPSIDRVRIELGNTGSKATIHRYLKELQEEEGATIDSEAFLTKQLTEFVAKLAAQLSRDAEAILDKERLAFKQERNQFHEQQNKYEGEIAHLNEAMASAKGKLESQEDLLIGSQEKLKSTELLLNTAEVEIKALNQLLAEKNKQINSLEKKHEHLKDSLEHYRESVKTQREQDLRRHDNQVQTLQLEQRQLNQTLSIKQAEITQLNRDNAEFIAEIKALSDEIKEADRKNTDYTKDLSLQSAKLITAENKISDMKSAYQALTKELDKSQATQKQLAIEHKEQIESNRQLSENLNALKVELIVKNELYEQILKQNAFLDKTDAITS